MLVRSHTFDIAHLPVSGTFDNLAISLEQLQSEQPIVIGRLVTRRNAQPFVIRIK